MTLIKAILIAINIMTCIIFAAAHRGAGKEGRAVLTYIIILLSINTILLGFGCGVSAWL